MTMRLHKWGNSLGVRVPAHYIKQLNLTESDPLEMVVDLETESIIIRRKKYDLLTLLSQVKTTQEEAWEEDSPRGHEVW